VPISDCPDNSSQSGAQISELDEVDRRKDDESALPDNGSPVDVECNNPAFCGESVKVAPVLGLFVNQFL
jgi:hypothetical protein